MRKCFNILLVVILLSLVVIFGLTLFTHYADGANVTTGHEPKYCVKKISEDGKKVTYYGLGYKVIRYCKNSSDEPFNENIGVAMGDYKLQFELPDNSKRIMNMNEFYNTTLTRGNDIRNLSNEYGLSDAEKDGCYVLKYNKIVNGHLYDEFLNNYNQDKDAFIRIAYPTVEGDVCLIDVLYNSSFDQVLVVTDSSRDKFSSKENRMIKLKDFEKLGVIEEDVYAYTGESIEDSEEKMYICTLKNK